eukprot:TRINITY_DN24243_c0_g2_i1.p1 TRINITY_DN24243_c0_g2~~TRINITY_DN24243_c0_g2_i1.p1  ORF type:complete len:103 (+),score=21.63 TRINITY_DN24243_c0_g2_i1:175-483(+)
MVASSAVVWLLYLRYTSWRAETKDKMMLGQGTPPEEGDDPACDFMEQRVFRAEDENQCDTRYELLHLAGERTTVSEPNLSHPFRMLSPQSCLLYTYPSTRDS